MFTRENWSEAVEAAAKVIHEKRHGGHLWSADEIAEEALRAAMRAAVDSLPTVQELERRT